MLTFIAALPVAAFVFFLVLQFFLPKRTAQTSSRNRVLHNLLLFLCNSFLMRFIIPLSLVSVALWSAKIDVGIFNWLEAPALISVTICVVVLDFMIYWQHVATHHFEFLWRFHKVHHADHEMDVTTAIRFHPVELVLSLVYKSFVVLLLGAPILAVVIFETLLFIGPAFNHSNVALPSWLDKTLRWVIATPDVHRAHHSTIIEEQNTNYGFFLIWWDKLFHTYTEIPQYGHEAMPIGLADEKIDTVDEMLLVPFRN